MPPKNRYTREQIVQAALSLVREEGESALTARALAARLGCSAKPIFGAFSGMEEVRAAVLAAAEALLDERTAQEIRAGVYPPYKASGMAYVRFAKEERALFSLLYMRRRTAQERAAADTKGRQLAALVARQTGLDPERAYLLQVEMWVIVHGIATLYVTEYLDWDEELVSMMLTDGYNGLRMRHKALQEGGQTDGKRDRNNGADQTV